LPAGSAAKCPEGTEVSKDECLAAGLATSERSSIYNPKSLFVDDQRLTPCGCFLLPRVDDSMIITYDTGRFGCTIDNEVKSSPICKETIQSTQPPSLSNPESSSVPSSSTTDEMYYLWPVGSAAKCPEGLEVPRDECLTAAGAIKGLSIENPTALDDYEAATIPCGCVLWPYGSKIVIAYNDDNSGCAIDDEKIITLICKVTLETFKALPSTSLASGSTPSSIPISHTTADIEPSTSNEAIYYLLPAGSAVKCPKGREVPKDECLAAGLQTDFDIYNPLSLFLEDLRLTPCGCSILPRSIEDNMMITYDTGQFGCSIDVEMERSLICKSSTNHDKPDIPYSSSNPIPVSSPIPSQAPFPTSSSSFAGVNKGFLVLCIFLTINSIWRD